MTDFFRSYIPACRDANFIHKKVNHSEHYVSEERFHTNEVENLWRQIKKYYKERNGVLRDRMESFLIEVSWKYKTISPRTEESVATAFFDLLKKI